MKKTYIAPDFEVIKMELGNAILAMSNGNPGDSNIGGTPSTPEPAPGSGGGYWDVD